ncbi:MAG TPA: hypothetical protein VGE74_31520 [Gemmata sp.]
MRVLILIAALAMVAANPNDEKAIAEIKDEVLILKKDKVNGSRRDSLIATVGLIAAAASITACLMNRLSRTGTVARDNVKLMHELQSKIQDKNTDSDVRELNKTRVTCLASQNDTLLRRYASIQLILGFLCAAIITQAVFVAIALYNIPDINPSLAIVGLLLIFLGAVFAVLEWLHSVDALAHEVKYGEWLTCSRTEPAPNAERRALLSIMWKEITWLLSRCWHPIFGARSK